MDFDLEPIPRNYLLYKQVQIFTIIVKVNALLFLLYFTVLAVFCCIFLLFLYYIY